MSIINLKSRIFLDSTGRSFSSCQIKFLETRPKLHQKSKPHKISINTVRKFDLENKDILIKFVNYLS